MAVSSSSGIATTVVLQSVAEKLGRNNHNAWRAQVLATLCGAQLDTFISGKKTMPEAEGEVKQGDQKVMIANPEYEVWLAADQQVPGFILAFVSKEIFVHTPTTKIVAEALKILEEQFSSQTRARAISTCMALATSRKGSLSV
jgi:hypothetical protein